MKTALATAATAILAVLLAGTAQAAPSQPSLNANAADADANSSSQPAPEPAGASLTRIVRLSQVRGTVKLDRNIGQGFEPAFPNLPITEDARLETGDGFAEVEFEDNSTLRLAPQSLVEFPRLELLPSGAKLSTVNVVKGTVYVSRADTKHNDFTLTFGNRKVFPQPSSHLRLEMEGAKAELAVMHGQVGVPEASGRTEVDKKKTVTFNLAEQKEPAIAKGVAENQNDRWDKTSLAYHNQYARSNAFSGSPYAYGISDLNYYGSFTDFGGCGSMWRPYFVSAAWSPFSNGLWAWYPNIGYSWVSPYPWGWMPFHFGAWSYCSGFGWGWMPGGSWIGLRNSAIVTSQAGKPFVPGGPPVHGPVHGRGLIPVNLKPLSISGMGAHGTFVFRNNSAGLGVPRGNLGSLRGFSRGAEHHGSIAEPVFVAPLQTGRYGNREGSPGLRQNGYPGRPGAEENGGAGRYSEVHRAPNGGAGRPYNAGPSEGGMRGGGMQGGGMRGGGTPGGGMSRGGGAPSSGAPAGAPAGGGRGR